MKRRHFLGAGLAVSFLGACSRLPVIPDRPAPDPRAAQSWIRYARGRYTLFVPRVEMGQNIATGLLQIACDELGIAPALLDVRLPSTRDIDTVKGTVGSDSMREFALPLAQACATLRDALAAGRHAGLLEARPIPMEQLRAFGPTRGTPVPPVHGREIVCGAPLYAADVCKPGMLFGRVLRAPASPELRSTLKKMREAAARADPALVAIVRGAQLQQGLSEGVGIVARTPGALDRIAATLAPEWSVDGSFEQAAVEGAIDIDARLRRGRLRHLISDDRIGDNAQWDIDLRLDIPSAAHAAIEPRAAVADWSPSAATLTMWVGSQDAFYQRDVVARRLGLAPELVLVHPCRVGGGFGGKTLSTVELEAAVLAHAVGATVKVQWTREQEFCFGFHRPPSSHRIRVRLKDGRVDQWWHAFASSHILFTNAALPAWMQRFTDLVGDAGVARGADMPYQVDARRIEFDLVRLPLLTGPWRGLGAGPNCLAVEMAFDAAARQSGTDALAFRLRHIRDPRLARVLRQAGVRSGWGMQPPHRAGYVTGRGVACGIYKAASYAAVVAEVTVDLASGAVRVTQLWCCHDCGMVINPDLVRAQCEGNLVWGLGMVLVEALGAAGGRIGASSFADSPIPRIDDVPPMQIDLIESAEAPSGAGETAMVAAGGAIANALAAATGLRAARLPVRRADVLRALAQAGRA